MNFINKPLVLSEYSTAFQSFVKYGLAITNTVTCV